MRLPKLYLTLLVVCTSLFMLPGAFAQSCSLIPGTYAFLVTGHLVGPPTTQSQGFGLIGSFQVDSFGKVLYGLEDINSPTGFLENQSITGSCPNRAGGGKNLVLQTASGLTQTFAIEDTGTLQYIGPGAVATGSFTMQDPYALHSEFFGIYGIDLSGETACLYICDYGSHPGGFISAVEVLTMGQRLNLNVPYSVIGKIDANIASTVALNQQVTGNVDPQPSPLGRLMLNDSAAGESADLPRNFVIYLVNANRFYVLSSDPHTTSALLSGIGNLQRSN